MAFFINIQDVYELGALVSFWAGLEPTDDPVTLPSQNPFRIFHGSNLVYQPDDPGGEVVLTPNKRPRWRWDQTDGWQKPVPAGSYTLKFYLKGKKEPLSKDFDVTEKKKSALKSMAKWCRRGCLTFGPVVILGAPLTGTAITVLAVPLEKVENDPPSKDYEELAKVHAVDFTATKIFEDPVQRTLLNGALRLGPYLAAIKTTMERLEGAEIDAAETAARAQERHLEALRADASHSSNAIAEALGDLARQLAGRVVEREALTSPLRDTLNDERILRLLEGSGGQGEDVARLLQQVDVAGARQVTAGPALEELQLYFARMATSLYGSARPTAIAA